MKHFSLKLRLWWFASLPMHLLDLLFRREPSDEEIRSILRFFGEVNGRTVFGIRRVGIKITRAEIAQMMHNPPPEWLLHFLKAARVAHLEPVFVEDEDESCLTGRTVAKGLGMAYATRLSFWFEKDGGTDEKEEAKAA